MLLELPSVWHGAKLSEISSVALGSREPVHRLVTVAVVDFNPGLQLYVA